MNYEVIYYKRLSSRWLKGRVRNLSIIQAIQWAETLQELFNTPLIKIREQD